MHKFFMIFAVLMICEPVLAQENTSLTYKNFTRAPEKIVNEGEVAASVWAKYQAMKGLQKDTDKTTQESMIGFEEILQSQTQATERKSTIKTLRITP